MLRLVPCCTHFRLQCVISLRNFGWRWPGCCVFFVDAPLCCLITHPCLSQAASRAPLVLLRAPGLAPQASHHEPAPPHAPSPSTRRRCINVETVFRLCMAGKSSSSTEATSSATCVNCIAGTIIRLPIRVVVTLPPLSACCDYCPNASRFLLKCVISVRSSG
jgi:hypothetical protein